jgi:SAM-dependent methyltransferase
MNNPGIRKMADVSKIYSSRFNNTGLEKRKKVWQVLCASYFQKLIPEQSAVLDLACGYGEFINNIKAAKKYGIDLNPDSPKHLNNDVTFHRTVATDLSVIPANSLDFVFTSNFLEHLRSKEECDTVMAEVKSLLRPGGRFIVMGPNIRYVYAEYWDYYDHYLALSHLSLAEGLEIAGYEVTEVIPRFLPYTMNNKTPAHPTLVRAYLALPIAWPVMGKQFLVTARKPLA